MENDEVRFLNVKVLNDISATVEKCKVEPVSSDTSFNVSPKVGGNNSYTFLVQEYSSQLDINVFGSVGSSQLDEHFQLNCGDLPTSADAYSGLDNIIANVAKKVAMSFTLKKWNGETSFGSAFKIIIGSTSAKTLSSRKIYHNQVLISLTDGVWTASVTQSVVNYM